MGINLNKRANNHRLFCYKIPKNESKSENLDHTKEKVCPFYAGLASDITSNPETIGTKMQISYDTFSLETYDFVDEIKEGDLIYITNFEKSFVVQSKTVVILRKGLAFSRLGNMTKATRLEVRGRLI